MADIDSQNPSSKESRLPSPDDSSQIKTSVGYSEYVAGLDLEFTSSEERRARWKIDLVIIPTFLLTQAIQQMDRTALNYVNLFGYQQALGLYGNQFNFLSSTVYAGYFFGQYPSGWLIGRFPAQRVLSISIFAVGVLMILMTQCKNYSSAMAVRFFTGFFVGAVIPCLTLMTGFWYTRREIPLRQCIWFSGLGWGGIVDSYISMGISKLPDGTSPSKWQLVFFILGGVSCFWGIIVFFFLPDTPSSASFLTPRERILAVARVARNGTGIKNRHFDRKQAWLAFYDPKTVLLFIAVAASAIPNSVITSFSTVIIRDMGFTTTKTTALKSVGDAIQIITLFIGGTITLNIPNCTCC
jgi:MFS family permease